MKTERTRLRRKNDRGSYDREVINNVLDAMPLCHIGFNDQFGTPAVIPTLQWREGDHVYWHASSAARSLKAMAGSPICLSVTIMDAFVMARSAINHSMNFRSVMIYGEAFEVSDQDKEAKLKGMFDVIFPGRWEGLRPINAVELKQTAVFGIEINEASAKIRAAGIGDDEADLDWPLWSGVVPISHQLGAPIDDENNNTGVKMGEDIGRIKIG